MNAFKGLHIGAGDNYLPGWVNIDLDATFLPDVQAEALALPFKAGVFDNVCMSHVIEHLPYRTLPAVLSGVYRVMRPGGVFILETPDIEGSFEAFLQGDVHERKRMLSFIFGLDMPGMKHEMLLPGALLQMETETAGFEVIENGEGQSHLSSPGLRIVARKKVTETADFWSGFWPKMVNMGVLDSANQLEVLQLRESVAACLAQGQPDMGCMFGLVALHPVVAKGFAESWGDGRPWGAKKREIQEIADGLWKKDWLGYMLGRYERRLAEVDKAMDYEAFVKETCLWAKGELKDDSEHVDVRLFSRYRHERFLRQLLVQGNKALLDHDIVGAMDMFTRASRAGLWLYGDLNMACTQGLRGRMAQSIAKYKEIFDRLDGSEYELLRHEINRRINLLKQGRPDNRPFNYGDFVWRTGHVCISGTA